MQRLVRVACAVATAALLMAGALAGNVAAVLPVAHAAATPTVVQSATTSDLTNSSTSLSVLLPNAASGDRVAVLLAWGGGNTFHVSGVAQTHGSTPSLVTSASDGLQDNALIYEGAITQSGDDTVSVTLTYDGCPGGCQSHFIQSALTAVEISGASASDGHAALAENGSGGTAHTASSPGLTASASGVSDLDLGLYVDGGANKALSVPSGETQLGTKNDNSVNIEWDQASASGRTSFEFDTSGSAAYSAVVAASFPSN